jgi:hypothetical protein
MNNPPPELFQFAKLAGNGMITERRTPAGRRSRPRFTREVIAPSVIIGGGFFLISAGAGMAAIYAARGQTTEAILVASVAIGAIAGTLMALVQMPHYRRLQIVTERHELPPRPVQDNGRARIIESQSPTTKTITRCYWAENWKRELAQRTHAPGTREWIGGDRPTRDLFTGLVTALSARWNPDGGDVLKDMAGRGLVDDAGLWTQRGKKELSDAVFWNSPTPNG